MTNHIEQTGPPGSVAAEPAVPLAGPWPRYWARSLDVLLWSSLLACALGFFVPNGFQAPSSPLESRALDQLLAVILLPFAMVLDSIVYAIAGNTPGKWLTGIRVLDTAGQRVGFLRYLLRNLSLCVQGLALGIGIIALFTLYSGYKTVRNGQLVAWDRARNTRAFQVRSGSWRPAVTATIYLVLLFSVIFLGLSARDPEGHRIETMIVNIGGARMVDADTRFDSAQAGPGLVFQLNYTLVNISVNQNDITQVVANIQGPLREGMVEDFCTSAEMKTFRDAGRILKYRYSDRAGQLITSFEIPLRECASGR